MSDINFKTGWLKDPADNQKFAPKTTTNQVLTGDGNRLTDELANIKADADTKLDEAKTFATNEVTNLSQSIEKGYVIPDVANAAIYDSNRKAIHTTYETKADAAQKDTTLRYDLSEGKLVPSNAYLAANAVCDEKGRDITSTYETKVDASNKYTESKSYTDTEVAKKAALGTDGYFTSKRDFVNGTLITTNIDYSIEQGAAWLLELKGNSYTSQYPFDLKLQGYIYMSGTNTSGMINYGGICNGYFFDNIVAFCYNGVLCFWFPYIAYWQGFDVRVTNVSMNVSTQENQNCVVSITDEVKPTDITKEISFAGKIVKSITSDNIGTQSVNYAVRAGHDANGQNIANTYETKADANNKLATAKSFATEEANRVKNDLLNGAGGAYDTLKELGDLIDTNVDAIEALETVAASKESKEDASAKLTQSKTYTDTEVAKKATKNHGIYYGTCNTASNAAAKVVTLVDATGFELVPGTVAIVKFNYTNTASNPTLNINSTGAKSIMRQNTTPMNSSGIDAWAAGSIVVFVYDGTNWIKEYNKGYSNQETGFGYGTCRTASGTSAKTVTIGNFNPTFAGIVSIKFTYGVTSSNSTLNINNTGSYPIYHKNTFVSAGYIQSNDIATFIFNGSQYVLITLDRDYNTTYTLSSFGVTATKAELNILDGATVTTQEINYLDGVTSNIQSQLNNKAAAEHDHTEYVDLTSNQNVTGIKTFENGIQIGEASFTYDKENKRIVLSFPEEGAVG